MTIQHDEKEPTETLYKKAVFLEQTLEKMQSHSSYLFWKIKKLKRKNPKKIPLKPLQEKLKDINEGTQEVFEKCDILWKKIAKQAREEASLSR